MTRVGIIVEGNGEVPAFKYLIPKLQSPFEILSQPLRADMQPKGTPAQVAISAKAAIAYFIRRNVDLVVVLIDNEDNPSASAFATQLKTAFSARYLDVAFEVVVKNSCIENWLIADIDAIKAQPKRFAMTDAVSRQVAPNKSDRVDAQALLNKIAIRFEYDKGCDPTRIARLQDPYKIASNSRSFRRLLRVLENPRYIGQSRNPV